MIFYKCPNCGYLMTKLQWELIKVNVRCLNNWVDGGGHLHRCEYPISEFKLVEIKRDKDD